MKPLVYSTNPPSLRGPHNHRQAHFIAYDGTPESHQNGDRILPLPWLVARVSRHVIRRAGLASLLFQIQANRWISRSIHPNHALNIHVLHYTLVEAELRSLLLFAHLTRLDIEFPCTPSRSSAIDDDIISDLAQALRKLESLSLGGPPMMGSRRRVSPPLLTIVPTSTTYAFTFG